MAVVRRDAGDWGASIGILVWNAGGVEYLLKCGIIRRAITQVWIS